MHESDKPDDDKPDDDKGRECAGCGQIKPLSDFSGKAKKCRVCEMEWAEFRAGIAERLDAIRPARAGVNEHAWREPVYAWARNHMPNEAMLVRKVATDQVNLRERDATRRGNDFLRKWRLGQMPLTWADIGFLPIRIGEQHVRLDDASPADMRQFARDVRTHAKQHYDAELLVAEAADDLAELATRSGYIRVSLIGDIPLAEGDAATA